jgi:DNA-binding NarL/FixJ family response regulator
LRSFKPVIHDAWASAKKQPLPTFLSKITSKPSMAVQNMPVRILIADDNDIVRSAIREILEQRPGFKVCAEAANGERAVQMFKECTPDCVILDFSMPVMNGIDAAREIMRISPDVLLLLCTMYGSDVVSKAAAEVGVKRIVSKSGNFGDSLVSTIEALVAN